MGRLFLSLYRCLLAFKCVLFSPALYTRILVLSLVCQMSGVVELRAQSTGVGSLIQAGVDIRQSSNPLMAFIYSQCPELIQNKAGGVVNAGNQALEALKLKYGSKQPGSSNSCDVDALTASVEKFQDKAKECNIALFERLDARHKALSKEIQACQDLNKPDVNVKQEVQNANIYGQCADKITGQIQAIAAAGDKIYADKSIAMLRQKEDMELQAKQTEQKIKDLDTLSEELNAPDSTGREDGIPNGFSADAAESVNGKIKELEEVPGQIEKAKANLVEAKVADCMNTRSINNRFKVQKGKSYISVSPNAYVIAMRQTGAASQTANQDARKRQGAEAAGDKQTFESLTGFNGAELKPGGGIQIYKDDTLEQVSAVSERGRVSEGFDYSKFVATYATRNSNNIYLGDNLKNITSMLPPEMEKHYTHAVDKCRREARRTLNDNYSGILEGFTKRREAEKRQLAAKIQDAANRTSKKLNKALNVLMIGEAKVQATKCEQTNMSERLSCASQSYEQNAKLAQKITYASAQNPLGMQLPPDRIIKCESLDDCSDKARNHSQVLAVATQKIEQDMKGLATAYQKEVDSKAAQQIAALNMLKQLESDWANKLAANIGYKKGIKPKAGEVGGGQGMLGTYMSQIGAGRPDLDGLEEAMDSKATKDGESKAEKAKAYAKTLALLGELDELGPKAEERCSSKLVEDCEKVREKFSDGTKSSAEAIAQLAAALNTKTTTTTEGTTVTTTTPQLDQIAAKSMHNSIAALEGFSVVNPGYCKEIPFVASKQNPNTANQAERSIRGAPGGRLY